MTSSFKLKMLPRSSFTGKISARFPADVLGTDGIIIVNNGGIYTFSLDLIALNAVISPLIPSSPTDFRERLASARTYYVRPIDGSDSATGLTNTTGANGAFKTIQKAVNVVRDTLDLGGFNVTIQLQAGNYAAGASISAPWVGAGSVTILGDATTPSNVVISVSGGLCISASGPATNINVSGVKLIGNTGLYAELGAAIRMTGKCDFGACTTAHCLAINQGGISLEASYNITGNSARHWFSTVSGYLSAVNIAITLSGSPVFSVRFAHCEINSVIRANGDTFSGSAGSPTFRYHSATNSTIFTGGTGASYLPGTDPGTTDGTGVYA